jgi:hypothetical protein
MIDSVSHVQASLASLRNKVRVRIRYTRRIYIEEQTQSGCGSRWLRRTASPTEATFHLLNPFLGLCLAVFSNRLPGSLAQVSEIYGKAPDGLSDP